MNSLKHRFRIACWCVLVASGAGSRLSGQAPTPNLPGIEAVDSMAGAEFARDSLASITVGIVTGQGLIWTKSYGFADQTSHRLANRSSGYRIGSITKMFTGLMLHQLLEAGKIRLSDPAERYFPEIRQVRGYSTLSTPITILELATMTSGLAREPKEEGPFWTGPVSRWEMTVGQALSHTDVEYQPGTKFSYSNIGYAILGATLGRVAGMPYLRWQQERILTPLGMSHTAFDIEPTIAGEVTTGYEIDKDGKADPAGPAREAKEGRGYKVPNGAIFTTVDDLSRFVAFELGHGPAAVLAPARLDSAYAGIVAATGDLDVGYGLGFMVQRRGEFTWLGHSGGVAGYTAMMFFDREHQLGVIVFRNATGGKVRPGKLATDALQHLILAKIAMAKNSAR